VIADAIDTLITLGWAALAWLFVFAAACALVLTAIAAAILTVARGMKTACARLRDHLRPELTPEQPQEPRSPHTAPQRPTPAWAHTDKEAA